MKKKLLVSVMLILSFMLVESADAQLFWNQAAKFEGGTNSYVSFRNSSSLSIPATFTIECWVYPVSTGASTRYLVFKQDGVAGATYYTGINSSNKLVVGTSPGINRVVSKSTIPLNKWTHIAAVFNNRFEIYINGVADTIGAASNAHATFSTDSLFIGKHPSGSGFNGMMDNIRIWESAKNSTEIRKFMRTTLISLTGYDDLVLNLPFQKLNSTGTVFTVSDYTVQNLGVNRGVTAVDLSGLPSPYLTPNEALDLQENNSRATIPSNPIIDVTGAFSIEAWVYLSSFNTGDPQFIISKAPGLVPSSAYRLLISGNQLLSFGLNSVTYEGSYTVPLAKWTHVALTLSGTGVAKMYANGILCDSINTGALPISNTDSLYIGSSGGSAQLRGYIDELKFVKKEKSKAEINEFLFKTMDASNEPSEENFCLNFDGSTWSSTSAFMLCFLVGNAGFSNPGYGQSIPVSPLLRADGLSFPSGFFVKSSDRNIPLTGEMVEDSILVTNGVNINDVNLFISLNHQRPEDLTITLVSPAGDSVQVLNNYSGVEQYYMNVTTIFDDQSNILMSNGDYADIGPSIRPLSGLNTVFSGQNAAGIWRLKIRDNSPNASGRLNAWGVQINNSTIGIQNVSTEIPDGFSLKQNYPNPFNPVTNIKFSVPKTGIVKLKVYDILGKEVAVLVDKQLNAGSYQADFNGSNFSSGVYFYKLEAEGFT